MQWEDAAFGDGAWDLARTLVGLASIESARADAGADQSDWLALRWRPFVDSYARETEEDAAEVMRRALPYLHSALLLEGVWSRTTFAPGNPAHAASLVKRLASLRLELSGGAVLTSRSTEAAG